MTPYAILLVRPADNDATIRRAFHRLAEQYHPDKYPGRPIPREWYAASAAYSIIKTATMRSKHERYTSLLSGRCKSCKGSGIQGTRIGKARVSICEACKGEGRTTTP